MRFRKTVVAIAAGAALVLTAPAGAHASDAPGWLCYTRDATPVYAHHDFTGWLFTLSPGRGFRLHSAEGVDATWTHFYGHGAERPDRDGWVRPFHIGGCV